MIRTLAAAFAALLAASPAWAAGETTPAFGLSPGASPNTLCIFDKSATRPCVAMGVMNSVSHLFASTPDGIDTSRSLIYATGPTVDSTAFLFSGNVTGTCDGSIIDPATSGKDCSLFRVYTGVTNLAWPATTPLPVFSVSATVGAGAQGGGITAGQFQLSENATTGMLTAHPFIALQAGVQAVRNEGGSAGVPGGGMWSLITYATLGGTGTFWNQVIGYEMDLSVNSLSASVADVIGMQIVETATHVVKGTRSNEAISIQGGKSADIPTVGWDCGLCFGGYNGYNPMNTGATLIGTWGHAVSSVPGSGAMGTVANGVDFSQYIFTGSAFKSPGFSVDGAGIVTGSAYKAGATAGVTCSGTPTASFASTLGIVTHC